MTEDVFPVMLHTFARAGFDPAPKFLKESIDPVFAAIAIGAAREYGREFCVNPDLSGLSGSRAIRRRNCALRSSMPIGSGPRAFSWRTSAG